jgi:hypothetical protein
LKVSVLLVAASAAATALSLGAPAASASRPVAANVTTHPGTPGKPKVVKIRSNDHKISLNDGRFRPGVTDFRVVKTANRRSSLVVLEVKDVHRAFKALYSAYGGGESPSKANAMKKFDRLTTLYGGGGEGARWQVKLSRGSYYVLDFDTLDVHHMATFRVKGEKRAVKMQHPDSKVWTTKANEFRTNGELAGKWVCFKNNSHEIDSLDAIRVDKTTKAKDVRRALPTFDNGTWLRAGRFSFEVQSPGIRTVHQQQLQTGRYWLTSRMPSEQKNGQLQVMMGTWLLVNAE